MTESNIRRVRPISASRTPAAPVNKSKVKQPTMIKLPNGNRIVPMIITGIAGGDTGVRVTSFNGDMIGFIPVINPTLQAQVMDLLEACKDAGKKFEQPDWSFLDQDDAVEETGDE